MLKVDIQSKLHHYTLDISFELNEEIGVLFGRSGAGKSTILHAIAGLHTPDDGQITIHDRSVFSSKEINVPPQNRKVGYVFQDYALFPHMTVSDNIYYGIARKARPAAKKHVDGLVNALGMSHLQSKYPHQLSGGEKQRVALIRALAMKPDVLLLDEPFSALDEDTRAEGHQELLRLKNEWKIPMLLVTHNREEGEKLADRLFKVDNGKLLT
ncbi:ATP-binding cassette domain-containing protein [Pontibacillus sp. HMF3514]|uniref:ATP-binding cassette domain-containing protein n=1 Tax=Pontibacillus sp. HMF3514 TaxID=2692425 RepID=UPI00131FF2F9|nr:ATP-binding cassette domain-containing protein [Pontibacillus sp. HMF3514]QHE51303.1 ATP-binding cassette domain-containing protein [Pontibacillus sp. HMF3514]